MDTGGSQQVTEMLVRWRKGERQALDALIPLVYEELRRMAQHFLQREKPGHTLQSRRWCTKRTCGWSDKIFRSGRAARFFGIAAQWMRQTPSGE